MIVNVSRFQLQSTRRLVADLSDSDYKLLGSRLKIIEQPRSRGGWMWSTSCCLDAVRWCMQDKR